MFIGGAHTDLPTDAVYANPVKIMDGARVWNGLNELITNGSAYYGEPREVEVNRDDLRRRTRAETTAPETGVPLDSGATVRTVGFVVGNETNLDPRERWITTHFSRIWSGGTKQKPAERDPKTRPLSAFDRIRGKRVFHAADPGTGDPITVTAKNDGGKVYRFAPIKSPLGRQRPLRLGERVQVVEFVHSEAIDGKPWWWRTKNNNRIHTSETEEQPYITT